MIQYRVAVIRNRIVKLISILNLDQKQRRKERRKQRKNIKHDNHNFFRKMKFQSFYEKKKIYLKQKSYSSF